jgi:hypothetical protein
MQGQQGSPADHSEQAGSVTLLAGSLRHQPSFGQRCMGSGDHHSAGCRRLRGQPSPPSRMHELPPAACPASSVHAGGYTGGVQLESLRMRTKGKACCAARLLTWHAAVCSRLIYAQCASACLRIAALRQHVHAAEGHDVHGTHACDCAVCCTQFCSLPKRADS